MFSLKSFFFVSIIFLFATNTFSQTCVTTDDIIKLKNAGLSDQNLQVIVSSNSLKITVDEIIKLKESGISEDLILQLALDQSSKNEIDLRTKNFSKLDWNRASINNISLIYEKTIKQVYINDTECIICDLFWSTNDDSIITDIRDSDMFAIIDPIRGFVINWLKIDALPKYINKHFAKSDLERCENRLPPGSVISYYKVDDKTYDNNKIESATAYLNYKDRKRRHQISYKSDIQFSQDEMLEFFNIDSSPNNKIIIANYGNHAPVPLFGRKESYIEAIDATYPKMTNEICVLPNNIFGKCRYHHNIKISNYGDKLAIANSHKKHNFSIVIFKIIINE